MSKNNRFPVIKLQSKKTFRSVNCGAERWLGKVIPVLDHGFVYLVDYMGSDKDIEQAARVSYGVGTRKVSQTKGLLRYLMKNSHTSPFEMAELKFHAKMPIFVARQWVRHRTASLNEYSARYSVLENEFYMPKKDVISVQLVNNKQGRGDLLELKNAKKIQKLFEKHYANSNDLYHFLLDGDEKTEGIARELARSVMPVGVYTQWYWKIDLHNLLHFLRLRMDQHAQYEIRVYADAIAKIVKNAFPITWQAFEDYQKNSINFSKVEVDILSSIFKKKKIILEKNKVQKETEKYNINEREKEQLYQNLQKIGVLNVGK